MQASRMDKTEGLETATEPVFGALNEMSTRLGRPGGMLVGRYRKYIIFLPGIIIVNSWELLIPFGSVSNKGVLECGELYA